MNIPGQHQESMIKAQEKTQNQGQDHRDLQIQQSPIRLDRTIDRPLADDLIFRTHKKVNRLLSNTSSSTLSRIPK